MFRFGPFEFDPDALELRRRGVVVRVHGQPLQILALLLKHHGALVTREALQTALWSDGTFVDYEHGVNAAVRRLRRVLEDEAAQPRYIQTIARRGYRFSAPLDLQSGDARAHDSRRGRAIAVLPFDNETGEHDREYLADGMTERVINELALIHDLRVIARSAVFRYKGDRRNPRALGRRLGVQAVIAGSISKRGETTLSIRAELVSVESGFQLWGRCYERTPEDLAGLAQELVRDIHTALEVHPSASELRRLRKPVTTNALAHLAYLKGRYFLNRVSEEGLRSAVDQFGAAIAADGRYGLAYCGLADCYNLIAFMGLDAPASVLPKARDAARAALRLDDELAEAHASLASVTKVYEWDWHRAELGYRRALSLNPSYAAAHRWYAAHLAATGRADDSRAAIERASALDPVSPIIATESAWNAYMARDFDAARSHAIDALGLQPEFAPAFYALGLACEQLGSHDEALQALRSAASQIPNPAVIAAEAHLLAVMDRKDEALALVARLEQWSRQRYVAPYWFAIAAAGLDDPQAGLAWLERAFTEHDVWLVWLKTEPRLDPFRAEARFQRVLAGVGLADPPSDRFPVGRQTPARSISAEPFLSR
jgi:TolB-like protein/Flp pilus assembly protein TadD